MAVLKPDQIASILGDAPMGTHIFVKQGLYMKVDGYVWRTPESPDYPYASTRGLAYQIYNGDTGGVVLY